MKTRLVSFLALIIIGISFRAEAQRTIIHEPSGVKIVFPVHEQIYPESWYSDNINGKYVPLRVDEYERSERIVIACLDMYPYLMLKKNLEIVYVVYSLEFFGVGYGGTNSNHNVYLTNKGLENYYDSAYISRVFHAEFSSILLRNFKGLFKEEAWLACNAKDFSYGKGGVNALKTNSSSEYFNSELNEMGFINQYATSDMENDFNSFAKNMFVPRQSFLDLLKKYPRLKKKSELLIDFYHSINSTFTKEYFENIEISEE